LSRNCHQNEQGHSRKRSYQDEFWTDSFPHQRLLAVSALPSDVPGQGLLDSIAAFITGPFGKAITLIAIVLCGVSYMYGKQSDNSSIGRVAIRAALIVGRPISGCPTRRAGTRPLLRTKGGRDVFHPPFLRLALSGWLLRHEDNLFESLGQLFEPGTRSRNSQSPVFISVAKKRSC
jgi:hypothetical protein